MMVVGMVVAVLIMLGCYAVVSVHAWGRTFDDVNEVPAHEYGLLLGTSPFTEEGERNYYYENRIKATEELYKAGKIKRIIASGGDYMVNKNGVVQPNKFNELVCMRDSLIAHGVKASDITLDYDGKRTLNSIINAKTTYGIDSLTLISQGYHNERAIYQADHYGLNAVGYNAAHSHVFEKRIKNILREFPARVKLFYDLWLGR